MTLYTGLYSYVSSSICACEIIEKDFRQGKKKEPPKPITGMDGSGYGDCAYIPDGTFTT